MQSTTFSALILAAAVAAPLSAVQAAEPASAPALPADTAPLRQAGAAASTDIALPTRGTPAPGSSVAQQTTMGGEEAEADRRATTYRKDATIASAIAVGAVAGGPVGAMLGAASGVWIANKVEQADQLEGVQADLHARRAEISALRSQLAAAERSLEQESERYARMALEQLELEMLFRTGDSSLSKTGEQRLALLADYLLQNAQMAIRIEGFADPRGDADYNLALSQARAEAVAAALCAQQVPAERIEIAARGELPGVEAEQGSAAMLDDYALQRVARIALYRRHSEVPALSAAQR